MHIFINMLSYKKCVYQCQKHWKPFENIKNGPNIRNIIQWILMFQKIYYLENGKKYHEKHLYDNGKKLCYSTINFTALWISQKRWQQ